VTALEQAAVRVHEGGLEERPSHVETDVRGAHGRDYGIPRAQAVPGIPGLTRAAAGR
jgi:hypothetical protein